MKAFKIAVIAVCALLLFSSCGGSSYLTSNTNLNQTKVVLSQGNFKVVKTVSADVQAVYIFGIGGCSRKALRDNALTKLAEEAELTGSQALVNVTVKQSGFTVLGIFTKAIYQAQGTVIEFIN